jgi:hypothetical protein
MHLPLIYGRVIGTSESGNLLSSYNRVILLQYLLQVERCFVVTNIKKFWFGEGNGDGPVHAYNEKRRVKSKLIFHNGTELLIRVFYMFQTSEVFANTKSTSVNKHKMNLRIRDMFGSPRRSDMLSAISSVRPVSVIHYERSSHYIMAYITDTK